MPTEKNGYNPPPCPDPRLMRIQVPCGKCVECRKRRASDWRLRMHQEYKYSNPRRFHFITLTFSRASLNALRSELGIYNNDNQVVKVAVRRFLERYRKEYKVSLRHFLVTERGDDYDHIHLHGIIIDCKCGYWKRNKYYADFETLTDIWKYGYIWLGWCNEKSISYILKYINKPSYNDDGSVYKPILLVSPGFGKAYCTDSLMIAWHNEGDGRFYHVTTSGHKIGLPRYYRLKLFAEDFLFARTLRMLDDPPPLLFRGRLFTDPDEYKRFIEEFYRHSVQVGTSFKKPTFEIHCNTAFYA